MSDKREARSERVDGAIDREAIDDGEVGINRLRKRAGE
jgi:hypothetical protein